MAFTKQQRNKEKFTREYKVREIQKSITKKTRLRKAYLKALKDEGYSVPEAQSQSQVKLSVRDMKEQRLREGKKKLDEKKEIKRQIRKNNVQQAVDHRQRQIDRLHESKEKFKQRERRSTQLTQRTRTGQPLMGPKINDLLDKIKKDDTYTR
ncbi:similar to Saccharomyces cerevisiae YLR068W FYV7 Essential protein required for maturation of 18S rRNA [Maudiozyma barnettii]|uniref:rRNA-processing protein FYV7 n=1 Tax=Maudiozyma barnettii TaxID=61262 RepID=A0A8H2VFD9_9SACH|nr:Fyv7p [Kazachstania barnettii]CAB4254144.1 similar to Saccharomyces cerevisiae YLR068W FYV7 Essential protein required for maturation of 18S rRNA [Kazachstania barnettii]CAD1781894.1 similar to Saccharomyces cerevisiae YLR068W FYV7 Essential protein required for maturation of 18S rRNA [Kazachstania barnettii]